MTHFIEDIEHHWAGDTLHLLFFVWESEDKESRKDLSGGSITWALRSSRQDTTVLSGSDPEVATEITTPAEGEVEVRIQASATEGLGSRYYDERLRITDATGEKATFGASFYVADPGF